MADNQTVTNQQTTFENNSNPDIPVRSTEKSSQQVQHVIVDYGGSGAEDLTHPLARATGVEHNGSLAAGAISGTYATLLTPGTPVHNLKIVNATDGDVVISFDSGSTDAWELSPGKEYQVDFASNGLETTVDVEVKDGAKASSGGTVYAIAYSD